MLMVWGITLVIILILAIWLVYKLGAIGFIALILGALYIVSSNKQK